MPKRKPLTIFAEAMIKTHYGNRPRQWIADQLGCSGPTVLAYAKRLGLWEPTSDKTGGRKLDAPISDPVTLTIAPIAGSPRATRPFIAPPTREQLMAGSANLRRVYKVEA